MKYFIFKIMLILSFASHALADQTLEQARKREETIVKVLRTASFTLTSLLIYKAVLDIRERKQKAKNLSPYLNSYGQNSAYAPNPNGAYPANYAYAQPGSVAFSPNASAMLYPVLNK